MECAAIRSYHPSSLLLKQVLGNGREERWKFVEEVFKSQVEPIYGMSQGTLGKVLDGTYRCRILCSKEIPLGVLIYDKNLSRSRGCLEIKALHVTEPESEDKPLSSYILNGVINDAKCFNARSISIIIPNRQVEAIHFFTQRSFNIISTDEQENSLLERTLENNYKQEQTKENPVVFNQQKRKWEEFEKKPTTQREPFRIPIPGQEQDAKRRRVSYPPSSIPNNQPWNQIGQSQLTSSTIKRKYLYQIIDGIKTIEGRINTGMFKKLKETQEIQFFCQNEKVICKIAKLNCYPSFPEMLREEGYKKCIPEVGSVEKAIAEYASIPGYTERAEKNGVVAIHLQVIKYWKTQDGSWVFVHSSS